MKSKGFTLLEVVISTAIFAIISVSIFNFYQTIQKNYNLVNLRMSLDTNFNEVKRELSDNIKKSTVVICDKEKLRSLENGYTNSKYKYCISKGYRPLLYVYTINDKGYLYAYDSEAKALKKVYCENTNVEKVYVPKKSKFNNANLGYEWMRIEKVSELKYTQAKVKLQYDVIVDGLRVEYDDGAGQGTSLKIYDSFTALGGYKVEDKDTQIYALVRSNETKDSSNILPLFMIPIVAKDKESSNNIKEKLVCDSIPDEAENITITKDSSNNQSYYTIHSKMIKNSISKEYYFRVAANTIGGERE